MLGEQLAGAGVAVVSGMARGVDACAHRGAIASRWTDLGGVGSRSGSGLPAGARATSPRRSPPPARCSPSILPGHRRGGTIFRSATGCIAGVSSAIVVVEAAVRSGALFTARQAVDEGREVLAVPGQIFSKQSVGPNTLLRLGARPLLTATDVLELVAPAGIAAGR